ncbi:MAG: TrmH family RNA methyltransferase [Actinobacteria bacterium]|nr:TrmH family RNA methyltransferase [Actinomycetota bacterium]
MTLPPAEIGPGEFYPVVGVGPHPKPWPTGEQYDPELLENGDRRNVLDHYRYWSVAAIVADLDKKRNPLRIAIENWQHDLNIGSIVRTANAFNVASVHIVGKRDWNRRGAMVTDKYLHVIHHPDVADFKAWFDERGIEIIGIDNVASSTSLESAKLPKECVLLFGQEGAGMSDEAVKACSRVLANAALNEVRLRLIHRWLSPPLQELLQMPNLEVNRDQGLLENLD